MSGVANNVVVLLKAGNCGHCTKLYTIWNSVCSEMTKVEKTLKFVVIPLPTMSSPIPGGFPKNLREYCPWYPFIFMVSGKDWDDSIKNGMAKFDRGIYYFNAKKLENGSFDSVFVHERDPKGFADWVKALINEGGLKPERPESLEVIPNPLVPKKNNPIVIQRVDNRKPPIYASISNCEDEGVCALVINTKGRNRK